MRKNFLPFIIILFFSACTGRDTNYWLEQAESYLNMKPDSTLILLHKIKNPDRLADYPKAKYNLYHTVAEIQKGSKNRTDSLISETYDNFIANNDSIKTSKACIWQDLLICRQMTIRVPTHFLSGVFHLLPMPHYEPGYMNIAVFLV